LIVGPVEGGRDGSTDTDVVSGVSRARRSLEIAIEGEPSSGLLVHVNGRVVAVAVAGLAGRAGRRSRAAGADAGSGPQQVVAPMPGRVIKVLVNAGDVVAAGQALVVVEAMKMENELRSQRAGTVIEVRAPEGALVEARAVLVVIA
jgi:biotin carboxyl carrier protein